MRSVVSAHASITKNQHEESPGVVKQGLPEVRIHDHAGRALPAKPVPGSSSGTTGPWRSGTLLK